MLNPSDLTVESFPTHNAQISDNGGYCCTGCTSGCGINPTAGGCESNAGSGDFACMETVASID